MDTSISSKYTYRAHFARDLHIHSYAVLCCVCVCVCVCVWLFVCIHAYTHIYIPYLLGMESSKLKARTSLLPRFSEKRRSSFELWALKQHSKMSPQVGLAVFTLYLHTRLFWYTWSLFDIPGLFLIYLVSFWYTWSLFVRCAFLFSLENIKFSLFIYTSVPFNVIYLKSWSISSKRRMRLPHSSKVLRKVRVCCSVSLCGAVWCSVL